MKDLLLETAGGLGVLLACVHGAIAQFGIFPRAKIEPPSLKRLLWAVWQAGTVAWIGAALLLALAPGFGNARHAIAVFAICVFSAGVLGNFWATRGRHFGWLAFSVVVALAAAGY